MKISNNDRAAVLVQALPYIQKYSGETIVVKYGGNAMINEDLKNAMMRDIVLMQSVGINVVLVHGGGPEINKMLERLHIESKFVNGLRYTDAETMEVVQEVLAGKVNKDLVQLMTQCGGRAVGLCGLDGGMIHAKKIEGVDLVTEGIITINRVLSYAKNYLEDNESYAKWSCQKDGASLIARMLFEESTDINFFVGRAVNPAHQNPELPINFNIKMNLVEELSQCLRQMGKRIKISYF